MRRTYLLALVVLASVAVWAACSGHTTFSFNNGGSNLPPAQPGTSAVSLTITDTPPSVTVLSFEVTVTSAILQPGNVQLVTAPIDIEIKHLETETAFISTVNVPAGTYSSVNVTFSNPELTIVNNSGLTIGPCANQAVCELKPPLTQATVTFSGPPFPLTINANSPIGLLLDFNLKSAIQNDFSVNPLSISFSLLPAVQATGELEEIEDVVGRVTAKDVANSRFTLHTSSGDLTITVDSNTRFEDFDEAGLSNNFSSLTPSQVVEVDLRLLGNGTLLAKKVELQESQPEGEVEGTIVSVESSSQFRMVVVEEVPDTLAVSVGNQVTVQIGSNAHFRVDNDGLDVPFSLSFSSPTDLLVGQNVQVRPLVTFLGSSGLLIQTDLVRLRMSHFTARVSSKSGSNFTVDTLPSLFTNVNPAINQILVFTSSQTEFENVSGLAALNVNDTVSLRGLLFKMTGIPTLVAKKVRKR